MQNSLRCIAFCHLPDLGTISPTRAPAAAPAANPATLGMAGLGGANASNPWAGLGGAGAGAGAGTGAGAGFPGMGGMPGMPGMPGFGGMGGQMNPAMMSEMMNNPMVQQVREGFVVSLRVLTLLMLLLLT